MSAHEEFRRRRIKCLVGFALGFVVFAGGGSLSNSTHSPIFTAVGILGFAITGISMALFNFGFRCPRCRCRIMAVNTPGTSFLSFPNFCAHCGLNLSSVDKRNEPISPDAKARAEHLS